MAYAMTYTRGFGPTELHMLVATVAELVELGITNFVVSDDRDGSGQWLVQIPETGDALPMKIAHGRDWEYARASGQLYI